jgi:hypothetical protein
MPEVLMSKSSLGPDPTGDPWDTAWRMHVSQLPQLTDKGTRVWTLVRATGMEEELSRACQACCVAQNRN